MEVKYFRLIVAIAEEGSIAGSSDKLFLTQSAISHQLRELEGQLGFKVFHRSRNRWVLTVEGEELYRLGKEIINKIERGFETIDKIRSGSQGTIRLSTECYSFYQGLPAFVQKMGLLYPEITVDLMLEATQQPVSKVLSGEIDMAIVTSKPVHDGVRMIKVREDEVLSLMHRENPLSRLEYLGAGDFLGVHLIIHSFPLESVSVYERFLKPKGVAPVRISAVPLTEVALEMVRANMGVMCLPQWALAAFEVGKNLVYKRIGEYGLKREHYLVVRESDTDKRYIKDFIASFEEEFSPD